MPQPCLILHILQQPPLRIADIAASTLWAAQKPKTALSKPEAFAIALHGFMAHTRGRTNRGTDQNEILALVKVSAMLNLRFS
eukprot:s26_g2.t1